MNQNLSYTNKAHFRDPFTDKSSPCVLAYDTSKRTLTATPTDSLLSPLIFTDLSPEDYAAVVTEAKQFGNDVTTLMFG